MVPVHFLSTASQLKYFTPSINRVYQFLSATRQHAFKPEDLQFTFITPASKKAGSAAIFSNITKIASGNQSLSDVISTQKRVVRDRMFHSLGYKRIVSKSWASHQKKMSFTPSLSGKQKRLLYKTQPHDQLDMFWWRCPVHNNLCMHTVNISAESNPIAPTNIPHKANTNPKAVEWRSGEQLKLASGACVCQYMRYTLSIQSIAGHILTNGTRFSIFDVWISKIFQSLTVKNILGGTRQIFNRDVFCKLLQLAANQMISIARHFVEYWESRNFGFQTLN